MVVVLVLMGIRLIPFGEQFNRENWQHYHDLVFGSVIPAHLPLNNH